LETAHLEELAAEVNADDRGLRRLRREHACRLRFSNSLNQLISDTHAA
jgi:hypothetical protein